MVSQSSPLRIQSVVSPPAREPWESPPPGGWGSSLRRVAFVGASALLVIIATVGEAELFHLARQLGKRRLHGATWAFAWGIRAAVAVLAVSLLYYLWRRREAIALVFAMLTDHRRVSSLRGRPPVFLEEPPANGLKIAHLSDLHLAETDLVRLVEAPVPAGNRAFTEVLASPALTECDLVLITGDITDRGTAATWKAFLALLDARGLSDRVVLVPGNHDINLVEPFDPAGVMGLFRGNTDGAVKALNADRFGVVQLANLLKFCAAFAHTAGGKRGYCYVGEQQSAGAAVPFLEAFAPIQAEVRSFLDALAAGQAPPATLHPLRGRPVREYERPIEQARRRLLSLFPVAVPFPGHDAVLYVLNSSTTVSSHPATNALGGIGRSQMLRLQRLALAVGARTKLVALHHHLVRRGEEAGSDLVARLFASFGTLGDAMRLIRFCDQHQVRAVLNGHRHLSYQLRLPSGTVLLAAPSSTLGDELTHDPRPAIARHDIAPERVEPSVGIYHRMVRPPSPTRP